MFFGNEQGVAGTRAVPTDDYIAVELVDGRPRLVVDLGAAPLVITSHMYDFFNLLFSLSSFSSFGVFVLLSESPVPL